MDKFKKERLQELDKLIKKAYDTGALDGFEFSKAMHDLFITYPIIDTGNWENVNAELLLHLAKECKKHPFSWHNLQH
jgi:hypothetical protein